MLIRTCNAIKTNHNDQLHVQHTTNAKFHEVYASKIQDPTRVQVSGT